jgi:hypothetical protein
MANGAAAANLLPTLGSAPAPTPLTSSPIEQRIGAAVAGAAITLNAALAEFRDGRLRPVTRAAGGEKIAALYTLQQDTLGTLDFDRVARREGRLILRQHLPADFRRQHENASEAIINILLDETLRILDRVTKFEKAMAH